MHLVYFNGSSIPTVFKTKQEERQTIFSAYIFIIGRKEICDYTEDSSLFYMMYDLINFVKKKEKGNDIKISSGRCR